MAINLKWRGEALLGYIDEAVEAGLVAASIELQNIARRKTSIPNVAVRHKRKRDTSKQGGGPKGSQYSTWPHSSKPGESVRRRTGFGQKRIVRGYSRKKKAARGNRA